MKKNITEEVLSDDEFMDIVTPILENSEFYKRKKWQHHEHSSLYEHSLAVSYLTYKIIKMELLLDYFTIFIINLGRKI